jgi:hypothetical protein
MYDATLADVDVHKEPVPLLVGVARIGLSTPKKLLLHELNVRLNVSLYIYIYYYS